MKIKYDNIELYEVFSPISNNQVQYEMMKRGVWFSIKFSKIC